MDFDQEIRRATENHDWVLVEKIMQQMKKISFHNQPIAKVENTYRLGGILKRNTSIIDCDFSQCHIKKEDFWRIAPLFYNTTIQFVNLKYNDLEGRNSMTLSNVLKKNNTVTHLNLFSTKLEYIDAVHITNALKTNSGLLHIDLSCNYIRNNGAFALADMLKENNTLKTISLVKNEIETDGMSAIGSALESNSSLTELNLSFNKGNISNLCQSLLKNKSLKILILTNVIIELDDVYSLANLLENNNTLTDLNIRGNKIRKNTQHIIRALEKNTSLTNINISNNIIGEEAGVQFANILKSNTTLKNVCIGVNSYIEKKGLVAINNMLQINSTITELDLSGSFTSLEQFNLLYEGLCKNKSIITLNISSNNLYDKDAITVKHILHNNKTLTKLDLSHNRFKDEEIHIIAHSLRYNTTLKYLSLHSNNISKNGFPLFMNAFYNNKTLQHLELSMHGVNPDNTLLLKTILSQNHSLTFCDIPHNKNDKEIQAMFAFNKHFISQRQKLMSILSCLVPSSPLPQNQYIFSSLLERL